MSLLDLAVLGLATYRLARLITVDEGPAQVFFRLRYWMGVYDLGENGQPASAWGRAFECPHCIGVYVAIVLWLIYPFAWGPIIVQGFAVAGLQSVLWSRAARED